MKKIFFFFHFSREPMIWLNVSVMAKIKPAGTPLAWWFSCICQLTLMPSADYNKHNVLVQSLQHFLSDWGWWIQSEFDAL